MPAPPLLLLDPDDDVMVATVDLPAGAPVTGEVISSAPIPTGHKVAVRAVGAGQPVRKVGLVIGWAGAPIAAGDHVHAHNLTMKGTLPPAATRRSGPASSAAPGPPAGLVIMDSPGYDPASVTGQVASGATLICFTTGRGSCFGSKPAPTVKLSTTTSLYVRMSDDIDLDCGGILTGTDSVEAAGERIADLLCAVGSGEPTASERLGYGDEEFTPWLDGITL